MGEGRNSLPRQEYSANRKGKEMLARRITLTEENATTSWDFNDALTDSSILKSVLCEYWTQDTYTVKFETVTIPDGSNVLCINDSIHRFK